MKIEGFDAAKPASDRERETLELAKAALTDAGLAYFRMRLRYPDQRQLGTLLLNALILHAKDCDGAVQHEIVEQMRYTLAQCDMQMKTAGTA